MQANASNDKSIVSGDFDIWLPTVEEVTEQTAFMLPDAGMTITLPATAFKVMTVAGYQLETGTACVFSSRGDTPCGTRTQLDLVAREKNIYAAKAGGGYDTFTGWELDLSVQHR